MLKNQCGSALIASKREKKKAANAAFFLGAHATVFIAALLAVAHGI